MTHTLCASMSFLEVYPVTRSGVFNYFPVESTISPLNCNALGNTLRYFKFDLPMAGPRLFLFDAQELLACASSV